MSCRVGRIALLVVVTALVATAGVVAGRVTADTGSAQKSSSRTGQNDGYFRGLSVGEAQGRREGRALQEGVALPGAERKPVRRAFNDGYAAGAADAFAGYDGGWQLSSPYVVVLERGTGDITYRIRSRVPVKAGVSYYLCPGGHGICQRTLR